MRLPIALLPLVACLGPAGCDSNNNRSGEGAEIAPEGEGEAAGEGEGEATGEGEGEATGEGEGEATGEGEGEGEAAGEGEGEGPPPCAPPLDIDPFEAALLPLDLLTFQASGGEGAYQFSFVDNASGGVLNAVTGAYLSGEVTEVTDLIEVEASGCLGVARAEVRVVAPMSVLPSAVEVPPDGSFAFEVAQGSGRFAFLMASARSGGDVTPEGLYAAGGEEGADVVRVTDIATGEQVEVTVTVRAGAALTPNPETLFLASGGSHALRVTGGSGELTAAFEGAGAAFQDGVVQAQAEGASVLTLTDRFTGQQAVVRITTVAPLHVEQVRSGNGYSRSPVRAAGDLDGDGFDDVVVGWPEADVTAYNGGAVYVYRGGNPPDAEPARVFTSDRRRTEMGRSVIVADLDGDGLKDLAFGAPNDDVGANDNGAVYVYPGVAGRLFAENPRHVLVGPLGGDRYGQSLAACDVNGDGRTDLVVGAILAEDRDADPRRDSQGGVFVHLGHPDGFLDVADDRVWGRSPDAEGAWDNHRDLRLGWSLATGDFDGDGLCDVLAGSLEYRSANNRRNDGAAFLYRGRAPADLSQGGLEPLPSLAFAGLDPDDGSSHLGRQVALGDLDGDGLAEAILGQYRSDHPDLGNVDHGAVRIHRGRPLPAGPALRFIAPAEMDWSWRGDNPYDYVGWTVQYRAEPPTLLIASMNDEGEGGVTNSGALTMMAAGQGALPDPEEAVTRGWDQADVRFGQNGGPVGDMDGDGLEDLFIVAGFGAEQGYRVGTPWFLSAAEGAAPVAMTHPGHPSGAEVGRSVAVLPDLDGDGFEELGVGATRLDTPEQGVDTGGAFIFRGGNDGFSQQPDLVLTGHPRHSGYDLMGQHLSGAGDFDGDGLQDLAVLARSEDRPSNFDAEWSGGNACGPYRNDIGAAYVYRGRAGQLPEPRPGFVAYGPAVSANPEAVLGGLDLNGDGRGDLVLGARLHDADGGNDSGSLSVALGRPHSGDETVNVICETAILDEGPDAGGWLGWALTGLGDLDGDGCDDFAAGAPREGVRDIRREGYVRVYFGWGGPGCPLAPSRAVIGGGERDGFFGYGLSGGVDVDGDGVGDLAVSALGRVGDVANGGGAWIVSGAWLATLPREAVDVGVLAPEDITEVEVGEGGARRILGGPAGELWGASVALLRGPESGGRLALGAPLGGLSGVARAGSVRWHDVGPGGIDPAPRAEFGGQPQRLDGRLGDRLAAGSLAGRAVLVVGGYDAQSLGIDMGAAFPLILD